MRTCCRSPSFHVNKESSIVPVWFSLPILPIHLFNKHCLFSIISVVGCCLITNAATTAVCRSSVAPVCIEVDLRKELPSSV